MITIIVIITLTMTTVIVMIKLTIVIIMIAMIMIIMSALTIMLMTMMMVMMVIISLPIVGTDRNEANNILKRFNTILKQEEKNVIFYNNISVLHLHRNGLHLNLNGTIMLAENLLSRIRTF